MAKITEINLQKRDKTRCNVCVNGEYEFAISLEQIMKYRIKVGNEYSDAELEEIKLEAEKELALKKALNYISKTLKTKKQVIIYLKGKGYTDKSVYYVIDKLKEYNYINDKEYAKAYLESNKTEGKRLADYKLMMKGVNKTDISSVREGIEDRSKEMALTLAEKRLKNKEITADLLQKTYRYLLGRGFSYEEADYALKEYKKEL